MIKAYLSLLNPLRLTSNADTKDLTLLFRLSICNRQARLLYGLTQNGQMVCHLFDTNAGINGFFPLEIGGVVSDIAVIKDGIYDRSFDGR